MQQNDIHKLVEGYFDATLSVQEEDMLRQMLAQTNEDTEDIREAKAIMGIFATNRKLTGKKMVGQKPKTAWGKVKYAAILLIAVLFDALADIDNPLDNKISK